MNKHASRVQTAVARLAVCVSIFAIAACSVGPITRVPSANLPAEFAYAKAAELSPNPLSLGSFTALNDPVLDSLLARARASNTTLAQALARRDEARAYSGLTRYSLFPTATASGESIRSKSSSDDPFSQPNAGTTRRLDVGTDLSWEIDLFGSLRNQSAAVHLRAAAAQALLDDAHRSVLAEVAQSYFQAIGMRQRLQLAEDTIERLIESERIVLARVEAGRGTDLDLARAKGLRLQNEARVAQIRAEKQIARLRLATLVNLPLADLELQLDASNKLPKLPFLRAVGTPEQWLKRRPDVRAAELALRAANHDVGTQIAEYFPKLTLLGDFGSVAEKRANLFETASESWSYGPSLTWKFLDFGRTRQFVKAEAAQAEAERARYQETVLRALEETEAAFANLRAATQSYEALTLALTEAQKASRLAMLRFEAGVSDYLVVLDAERQVLDVQDQHASSAITQLSAYALIYRALAGDFAQ